MYWCCKFISYLCNDLVVTWIKTPFKQPLHLNLTISNLTLWNSIEFLIVQKMQALSTVWFINELPYVFIFVTWWQPWIAFSSGITSFTIDEGSTVIECLQTYQSVFFFCLSLPCTIHDLFFFFPLLFNKLLLFLTWQFFIPSCWKTRSLLYIFATKKLLWLTCHSICYAKMYSSQGQCSYNHELKKKLRV